MTQLLSLFSGKKEQGPAFTNKRTVIEDGNVAPGQAFKPKQRKFNELGEEISDNSSDEEDVEAEEFLNEQLNGPTQSFI